MADDDLVPLESDRLSSGVIDLAGVRLQRGMRSGGFLNRCEHRNLIFSQSDRRVTCQDCKRDVDGFDAFMVLQRHFEKMQEAAAGKLREAEAAQAHNLTSRAAKAVDRVWSGRRMAPCCPHCKRGLLPEDYAKGVGSMVSREMEEARRKREREAGKRPIT